MSNHDNDVKYPPPSRTARDERRWALLFIGDRGRTITFHHFKGAVIATLIVIITLAAVAGWFFSLYRDGLKGKNELYEEIDNLKQALTSLRNEKDIITARLVVAESRVEETLTKVKTEPTAQPPKKASRKTTLSSKDLKVEKPGSPLRIAAENFIVFYEPDINTLRVEYRIINTGSKAQPVTGRTVVILKDETNDPKKWLVLPRVPLISGKPTGDRGRSFSIYNFRTMRFKANDQIGPDQFKTAKVYVFTATGTLLMEKEYPVGIKSKTVLQSEKPKRSVPTTKKQVPPKPIQKKKPETIVEKPVQPEKPEPDVSPIQAREEVSPPEKKPDIEPAPADSPPAGTPESEEVEVVLP